MSFKLHHESSGVVMAAPQVLFDYVIACQIPQMLKAGGGTIDGGFLAR